MAREGSPGPGDATGAGGVVAAFAEAPPGSILAQFAALFEAEPHWAEAYAACCCDTGEPLHLDRARSFRDAIVSQNPGGSNKERLSLRCLRLGAAAMSCLALQLKDRGYVRLDLGDNQLGDAAVRSVCTLVRALPRLRWLGLAGNCIKVDGARELAEELETNAVLEGLELGGPEAVYHRPNVLGVGGLRQLLDSLRRNPGSSLTSLTLCHTGLSAEAGKHLAAFMEQDTKLVHLNVSSNPLLSEGICALMPQCSHLRVLDISDTGCRGELVHSQLCLVLQRSTDMVHISIAFNPIEIRPVRRISRALASCRTLVSVGMEGTTVDTEGVTALADALVSAPARSLTQLDLSSNHLSQVWAATAVAHCITGSMLQVLKFNQNPIGDDGVREIAEALNPEVCPASALQHLELSRCRIGTEGATHLLSSLAGNDSLAVLHLSDNFLDDLLDMSLLERLPHLHELRLSGNRLSHGAVQRASQACARNRQAAQDAKPLALRTEMHRLLYQETKLGIAKQQVEVDHEEIKTRTVAADKAAKELRSLRATEADIQRQLARQIQLEEEELQDRKALLVQLNKTLEDKAKAYAELQMQLRQKLRQREQDLVDLQVTADELDQVLSGRKVEHPQEVERIKESITTKAADTEQLQQSARGMRQQLAQLQEKALIDFKP